MKKKSKKKPNKLQKGLPNTIVSPEDNGLLTQQSESTLLSSDECKDVSFYRKDGKIYLILPINIPTKENDLLLNCPLTSYTQYKHRFQLDDPCLGFYLIYFHVSAENFEKVITAHAHFYPDSPKFVNQIVNLSSTISIQHNIDPTGDIEKRIFTTQLLFLGHSLVSYATIFDNPLLVMSLLKNNANANQARICPEEQKDIVLKLKKRANIDQIKFINTLSNNSNQSKITISDNDSFSIDLPDLITCFQHGSETITIKRCKILYHIHENECSFSGFRQLEDGTTSKHPENIKKVQLENIQYIENKYIRLETQKDLMLFLKLGLIGLNWFDQVSALHIATYNRATTSIEALMLYNADPFYQPLNKHQSPLDVAIEIGAYDLLPAFSQMLQFYDINKIDNIISHLLNHGHLHAARVNMTNYINHVDTIKLVERHPTQIAIMIAQKTETNDQKWLKYLETNTDPVPQQIHAIMEDADPLAINEGLLTYSELIVSFWKKYPLNDEQLNTFIDWCIVNKNTFPIEIIIVKLNKKLTLNANIECHDQLKLQYPQNITFMSDNEKIVFDQTAYFDSKQEPTNINERKVINQIKDIETRINDILTKTFNDKPTNMSYQKWFKLNYFRKQAQVQLSNLKGYEKHIKGNFDNILKYLVSLDSIFDDINEIIATYHHSTGDHETSIFQGKLTDDLTKAHQPILNLFDEINDTDSFALQLARILNDYKDELKTTLICNQCFFVKQFFLLIKNALLTSEDIDGVQKNSLLDIVDNIIVIATYQMTDLPLQDKNKLCDSICTWLYEEKKNTEKITIWIDHFFCNLIELCQLNPNDGLSHIAQTYLTLGKIPKENFIFKAGKQIKILKEARDILNLKKAKPATLSQIELDTFMLEQELTVKKIIIALNDLASLLPMFIFSPLFKTMTDDQYENINFALIGLKLLNQAEINHYVLKTNQYDLWMKPQFMIRVFETLDVLESIFDGIGLQKVASSSPN